MAITRDLWLVIRARDEASRIVRSFGTNVGGSAALAAKNMSDLEKTMNTVGHRMNQFAMTSMLAGSVLAGAGAAGIAFIKAATQVAAEYDTQVRRTITQIDDLSITMEQVANVGRETARQVGVPFETLQETLFFIFSSMDVGIKDAQKLLTGFSKEAVAGSSTVEAAAKSAISILNSLGLKTKDLGRIQDVQFQIVRKGIITYEELSAVIGRALPSTARAGQSFETLGAMMAFLTRNGLSAAMAAASAGRAMDSFSHPTTIKRLEQMGITVRDVHGEFLPLIDVMEQMHKKIGKLAAPERAKLLQELFKGSGGTIQARRFWDTAFKNFDEFETMLGHMHNSAGVFDSAYKTMSESIAAKSELIRNKWMLIKEALGRAVIPELLKLISVVERVLGWFDKLPDGAKSTIANFILWGSVISVVVGALVILVGTMAFFVSSILLAGSALIYVLGTLALVTAAIVLMTTVLTLAWQKSERFREIVKQLGDVASTVWSEMVDTVREVADKFKNSLQPSLEKLWDVIENKVIPSAQSMVKIWSDEVTPKLKEVKKIIIEVADQAFKVIANIIETQVIPAVEKLTKWWEENGDSIRPFISVAAELAKWLAIIAAIIVASGFVGFAATIGIVITAVALLVTGLTKAWKWIKDTSAKLREFFKNLVDKILQFGKDIVSDVKETWNKVKNWIKEAIQSVSDTIDTTIKWILTNIWEPTWRLFGDPIKEAFGLIKDTINFFVVLIKEIIKDWIEPQIAWVKEKWEGIKTFFSELWSKITSVFKEKSGEASSWVKTKFAELRQFISETWDKIKEKITNVLVAIYAVAIKPVVDLIKKIWNEHLKELWDKVKEKWEQIKETVKERIEAVKELFKNAKNWLIDAGKNIIQGLIDGITDKIKGVRDKLRELTEKIKEWKGPRAVDLKLLVPAGRSIMKGLMSGIADQIPLLKRQLSGITTQIGNIQAPVFNSVAQGPTQPPEQRTTTQYITVNTQEIDPRIHASELGFELDSRL